MLKIKKSIHGTLHSVDQYLNIKLMDVSVTDPEKFPHMVRLLDLHKFRYFSYIVYLNESNLFKTVLLEVA